MKQTLKEQTQRIMEIMGNMNLMELNTEYLNQILDKLSDTGMESLSPYEKEALQKMSTKDDDVQPPEVHSLGKTKYTLRFTPQNIETGKPLVTPEDNGQTFGDARFKNAYIHGEAERLAGSDSPIFIDGDLSQLDKPEDEQQIRMLLPNGEYECVAQPTNDGSDAYLLILKVEEDVDENDFELGEMDNYMIDNLEPPTDDLRNHEMGEQDENNIGGMDNYKAF
jgi:hypothetical protein